MERSLFVITIKPNILHIQWANIMKLKCTFLVKNVYINAFNCVTMLLFPPRIKKDVGRMLLCKRHYSLPVTSGQAPLWFVPLVDGTSRCPIGGDDQREWPPAKLCMVGVVVFNPQAPKCHFLPFLGQDCTKLEFYFIIPLHIGSNFNTYSCLHRWNAPLTS